MRTDILEYLQQEVYARCILPSNKFGIGVYYHIEAVVKNAELLADSYHADKEIVMIAAWLHDISSITDYALYKDHHIHGAEMARDILLPFGYDDAKIARVQSCIRKHRGSVYIADKNAEELCVADADAISHFDNLPNLLYLAYVERHMGIREGAAFVKGKLQRSYNKLSDAGKALYREKYNQVMSVLG